MTFTLNQIAQTINRTPQSVYRLFKSNRELSNLLKEHTIKEGHNVYYDETIYEWFCQHYRVENKPLVENEVGVDNNNSASNENTETQRPYNDIIKELQANIASLKLELQAKEDIIESIKQANNSLNETNIALQNHISAQEKDIESKTQQIERLIVSNNALSITVNRAQQERMLLEAKKKNLFQRIKTKLLGEKKTDTIIAETAPEETQQEPEQQ